MSTPASSLDSPAPAGGDARQAALAPRARPWVRRAALVCACLGAGLGAAGLGAATPALLEADPELARLLRAMAVVKAVLLAPALALLWWRLGRPVALAQGLAYGAGAALGVGACVVIWKLAFLVPAAVAFHLGLLALLIGAGSDRSLVPVPRG